MSEPQEIPVETDAVQDAVQDEPFLGTVDIILLVAMLIGALYYLFKRNKKEERPATRSYAIQ